MSGCVGILLESRKTNIFLDDSKPNSDTFFFNQLNKKLYCETSRIKTWVWALEPDSSCSEAGENACRISFLGLWPRTEGLMYNKQQPELGFGFLLLPSVFQCPKAQGPLSCLCTRGAKIIAILSTSMCPHVCMKEMPCPMWVSRTACFLRATKCSHPRFFFKVFNKEWVQVSSVLLIDSYW